MHGSVFYLQRAITPPQNLEKSPSLTSVSREFNSFCTKTISSSDRRNSEVVFPYMNHDIVKSVKIESYVIRCDSLAAFIRSWQTFIYDLTACISTIDVYSHNLWIHEEWIRRISHQPNEFSWCFINEVFRFIFD